MNQHAERLGKMVKCCKHLNHEIQKDRLSSVIANIAHSPGYLRIEDKKKYWRKDDQKRTRTLVLSCQTDRI